MRQEKALSLSPMQTDEPPFNFAGVWKNELGSTMTLEQDGDELSGSYISSVSGNDDEADGTIKGWVNGEIVSFAVNWTKKASITTWIGHLVSEGGIDTIETLWSLATKLAKPADPTDLWDSIFAGADQFTRT